MKGKEGEKASLREASEFIQEFKGHVFVIKIGGDVVLDKQLIEDIAAEIIVLHEAGIKPILLHGGGPAISKTMEKVGKKPVFVEGLRFTDEETMEVVMMALIGKVGTEIVSVINKLGGKAISMSGKSANLIVAKKKVSKVDLGLVGEITQINPQPIHVLIDNGYIPIVAPVAGGSKGESYNINADTAAAEFAVELGASKLLLLTNVEGVADERGEIISHLNINQAKQVIEKEVAKGGMIPKIRACIRALEEGVPRCHIIKARKDTILEEVFTKKGKGTMITKQ